MIQGNGKLFALVNGKITKIEGGVDGNVPLITSGGQLSDSGLSASGLSGHSGFSGKSGWSGFSGVGTSGFSGVSGYSGAGASGFSGRSGFSGYSGAGLTGASGYSGVSGVSGLRRRCLFESVSLGCPIEHRGSR